MQICHCRTAQDDLYSSGDDDSEVRVGDKVYFMGYHNEIKDGRIIIKIGNVMTRV